MIYYNFHATATIDGTPTMVIRGKNVPLAMYAECRQWFHKHYPEGTMEVTSRENINGQTALALHGGNHE